MHAGVNHHHYTVCILLLVKPEDAKGGFVSPFAVTSQDLLFRCWEQLLAVQAQVTKNSLFAPHHSTSSTQTLLQRVAFFKTRKLATSAQTPC